MGSRDKDQTTPHQPLLSSLVIRPVESGGGSGGGPAAGVGGGNDYEPGEVRRDQPPPYPRSSRFHGDNGYRLRAGSVSPLRRRADHRYSPEFDHLGGPPRSRGYGSGRDPSRYRGDYSPQFGRGRDGARLNARGFDAPGYDSGPLRGEAVPRNNPNVRPRDGDWFCPDPLCNNLNFARREFCNNCKRPRFSIAGSPKRGVGGHPPPPPPPRRFSGPPSDRSPGRIVNGYRSPPRGWVRNDPRDFRANGPPSRREGRFPDPPLRRDRPDYPEDDYRDRNRFERPLPTDFIHRERGREQFFNERKGYDRRQVSPPPLAPFPPRGQWARDIRDRSQSPMRGGAPPKDYRRDMYMERVRDDRRGMGRGAAY